MLDRLVKLIKGFFGLFISNLETANPKALLEAETNALSEAVANYNTNLAKQAALVEKLRGQIARQKKEVELKTAKAKALYNAKQLDEAGRLALEIKTAQGDLASNEEQLKQADDLYVNLTRQRDVYVKDAQKRMETIKQKLTKAEIAESQAKLAEIATTTAFNMAGSGATLERLDQKLDDRVAAATGKARVAADAARGGNWAQKEAEDKAMESQALAEFASAMGLEPPPGVQAPLAQGAQTRQLGPEEATRELGPRETA